VLAFGPAVAASLAHLISPQPEAPLDEQHLRHLLLFEPLVLAILGLFLWARGWTWERLGALPKRTDAIAGFALCIATYGLTVLAWAATEALAPQLIAQTRAAPLVQGSFSLGTVLTLSAVNAIFEELFVCAYLVAALEPMIGVARALSASIALRLLYHLYQGPLAVLVIVPLGLVYTLWFVRTRRLWPLVIAHAVTDMIGLGAYVG
jgi:membrane protease YdiL (CAAX protease family)